ncbi:MAG: hypothetical protein ABJ000_05750 [Saccharospirillum sp.]|uniref:hypothetical protein n=1 Tax=Saccharospirillum sp. TaxID=2033801 RepID=UPI00329A6924
MIEPIADWEDTFTPLELFLAGGAQFPFWIASWAYAEYHGPSKVRVTGWLFIEKDSKGRWIQRSSKQNLMETSAFACEREDQPDTVLAIHDITTKGWLSPTHQGINEMAKKLRDGKTPEELMNLHGDRLVSLQCLTSNWLLETPVFEITGISYRSPDQGQGVRMMDLIEQERAGKLDMGQQFKPFLKGRVYDKNGKLAFEEQLLDMQSAPVWQVDSLHD